MDKMRACRRLDRSAKRAVERPCLDRQRRIVERRSLHAALRALVEMTEDAKEC